MNKFDIEYNKILEKENILQQNIIEQYSLKQFGQDFVSGGKKLINGGKAVINKTVDAVSSFGSNLADAISNGVRWGVNKIKATLQKLWNALTPNNSQQISEQAKKLINVMPDFLVGKAKNAIQISQSAQFKQFMHSQIKKQFKTPSQFNQLSNEDKKKFLQNKIDIYMKNNNIISQELISEEPVSIGIIIWSIIKLLVVCGVFTWIINKLTKFGKDIGWVEKTQADNAEQKADAAKHRRKAAEEYYAAEIEKAKFEQWKSDQQRQKIFRQIINVPQFQ